MGLQFGIFDHIEPVPGLSLHQIYRERLLQLEQYDAAGFYAYHLAEHHTPAVHSLAPSQKSGALPKRLPGCSIAVHPTPTARPLCLRPATASSPALDRGSLHAGPLE